MPVCVRFERVDEAFRIQTRKKRRKRVYYIQNWTDSGYHGMAWHGMA
jgi:hypothetical protein